MLKVLENREEWKQDFRQGWLAHHQKTGEFNWKIYAKIKNKPLPVGSGLDLSKSRLQFISTAGAYLAASQEAFDAPHPLGDYSIRLFPTTTEFDALTYAHDHYDHTAVKADPQVLLPLRHLAAMVAAGQIGELAPSVISFSGYQPDATRVFDELIPAILEAVKAEKPDAALLVPA